MNAETKTPSTTPDSAASALSAGLGAWLPIETAPKDGTHVLIKPKKYGYMNGNQQSPPCVAHWFVDPDLGGYWVISVSNIDIPGFWMPLPEAPNVRSQATDAALSRQVACTDGLGVGGPTTGD